MILQGDNRIVGSSSYLDIKPEHRALEIGATWINREWRGTFVNPEAKYLMLQHAFETQGAIRVQLKADARNEPSVAAMRKLNLVYEGTLRKHMIKDDGTTRDTAFFSVLDDEWPAMKQRLEDRLATLP